MAAPRFYLQRDVIELFGCSERWFRTHRSELEQAGFPKLVEFGAGVRPKYLRQEVDAYFERIGKKAGSFNPSRAMLDRKHKDQDED